MVVCCFVVCALFVSVGLCFVVFLVVSGVVFWFKVYSCFMSVLYQF